MLIKVLSQQGAVEYSQQLGDILDTCESDYASIDESGAAGAGPTAAQLLAGDIYLTGAAGAYATILPAAEAILAAVRGNQGLTAPPDNSGFGSQVAPQLQWPANLGLPSKGATFRRTFINNNGAGNNTITGTPTVSGTWVVGTATLATATWREYLVRIVCSTPAAAAVVTTVNASKNLTVVDLAALRFVTTGMSVYGTGIGVAAVVDAVNYDTGVIHVTVNSTASASNIAITLTPTVTLTNIRAGAI